TVPRNLQVASECQVIDAIPFKWEQYSLRVANYGRLANFPAAREGYKNNFLYLFSHYYLILFKNLELFLEVVLHLRYLFISPSTHIGLSCFTLYTSDWPGF
ncbi:hypothetical protein ACJX0J_022306, partial [Zea mays]